MRQSSDADSILASLESVAREREQRARSPALAAQVVRLKNYQQQRFARSYADLLASPRYGAAARFFLDDLYGPRDFSERDAQFARIVPALVRLFPRDIVGTVGELAALHALSERLDSAMARSISDDWVDAPNYLAAWQAVGEAPAREAQVQHVLSIGRALDRYTRVPMLAASLRMMRGPAQAAGLRSLQQFLETGFDTFKAMRGAEEFLATFGTRERELMSSLFSAHPATGDRHPALVQLP
jgi:hypothetical protein